MATIEKGWVIYEAPFPKKYEVVRLKDGLRIQFGDARYAQYKDKTPLKRYSHVDHLDPDRKKRYYARHGRTSDKTRALYWANRYLW